MLSIKRSSIKGFDRRVWVLFAGRTVAAAGFTVVMPFLAIYLSTQLGMPMTSIGLLYLAMAVASAFGNVIGGELTDRFGRRPVMVLSLLMRGAFFVLLSLSISYSLGFVWIAITVLASTFVGSPFEPASNAMVADIVPPGRRMEAYGLLRVGQNFGWVLGPLVGGVLAMVSYGSLFMLAAASSLSAGALVFLYISEPTRAQGTIDRFKLRDVLEIKKDRTFLFFCFASLPLFIVLGQLISTFAVFSEGVRGLTTVEVGYLYAVNGLMVVTLQFWVARHISRYRMTSALAFSAALYAIGYFLVGFAGGFVLLTISIAITTMGEIVGTPASMDMVASMSPEKERGRYMGVFGLFNSLAWSLGPFFGGILYDRLVFDPPILWSTIAVIALLSLVMYLYLGRMINRTGDHRIDGQ